MTVTALTTRVARVCVHPNGALVVRVATAPPGPVQVEDLPLRFAADSLRVRAASGAIRDVRERCAVRGPTQAGPSPQQAELRDLEHALADLQGELEALERRLAVFAGLGAGAAPERVVALPPAEALAALDDAAAERLDDLESRRDALLGRQRELRQARARAAAPRPDPEPPRFHRGVAFTVEADGPTSVEIEYFVDAARWVPAYRVDVADGQARLQMDALVAQASGEDWADAEIALATAALGRDTTLPELMSWRIGTAQAPQPKWRPAPAGLDELFRGYEAQAGTPRPPAPPPPPARKPMVRDEAPAELEAALFDEDDDGFAPSADMAYGGAPPPPPAMPMPLASRAAAPGPAAGFAPEMKRRKAMVGGGGPGGMAGPPAEQAGVLPPTALSERLRHGWLRLVGPDEPGRGTLRSVVLADHLWSLVEDAGVVGFDSLRRALDALEDASARLRRGPVPPGTRPVDGEDWHFQYPATGRHAVPGDGQFHRVAVRTDAAEARVVFRAVPRHSTDVHRFCTLATPAGVPYPSGPLQVYIDGRYRVTAPLVGQAGQGELTLALGLEPAVRVVERTARVQQADRGLMNQTTRVDHHVHLAVRNGLSQPAVVQIYDRLPTVDEDTKDIEISLLACEPEPEQTDRDPADQPLDGGLRWTLTVPAGAAAPIDWRYRVELPAKFELAGGNRRE